jgi:hypothetical protein
MTFSVSYALYYFTVYSFHLLIYLCCQFLLCVGRVFKYVVLGPEMC